MKIIQVCEHFRPGVNGLTNYVYNLSYHLSKKRDVSVFTSDIISANAFKIKRAEKSYEKVSENFEIFRFRTYPPFPPYAKTHAMTASLIRNLAKSDANVIHTHSYMLLHSDVTSIVSKLKKTPLVFTVHAYGDRLSSSYKNLFAGAYNATIGRVILNCASKIIVLTPEASSYFSNLGVEKERIQVIPNGIDYGKFVTPLPSTDFREKYNVEGKTVLFVGLLQQRKGVQYLLKAAPQILRELPDTSFFIVGEGEFKRNLIEMSNSLGIKDRVRFTGFLPDKQLLEAYALADVFVLPSAFEGLPTAILEAMASGKPVVATNVGGISSVVEDNVTGLLVNYRDTNKLAMTITTILKDESLAKRLGGNGRKLASHYDWGIISKKVEDLYLQVIGNN